MPTYSQSTTTTLTHVVHTQPQSPLGNTTQCFADAEAAPLREWADKHSATIGDGISLPTCWFPPEALEDIGRAVRACESAPYRTRSHTMPTL